MCRTKHRCQTRMLATAPPLHRERNCDEHARLFLMWVVTREDAEAIGPLCNDANSGRRISTSWIEQAMLSLCWAQRSLNPCTWCMVKSGREHNSLEELLTAAHPAHWRVLGLGWGGRKVGVRRRSEKGGNIRCCCPFREQV